MITTKLLSLSLLSQETFVCVYAATYETLSLFRFLPYVMSAFFVRLSDNEALHALILIFVV